MQDQKSGEKGTKVDTYKKKKKIEVERNLRSDDLDLYKQKLNGRKMAEYEEKQAFHDQMLAKYSLEQKANIEKKQKAREKCRKLMEENSVLAMEKATL